jgi:Fe-S-cluster containining protein
LASILYFLWPEFLIIPVSFMNQKNSQVPSGTKPFGHSLASFARHRKKAIIDVLRGNALSSESTVDCGTCRACCSFQRNEPKPGDDLSVFVESQVDGETTMVLPQKDNMECLYLSVDNGCDVYENRPTMCRIFDCRDYAATGLTELLQQDGPLYAAVQQWDLASALRKKEDWYVLIALCRAAKGFIDNKRASGEIAGLAFLNYQDHVAESPALFRQFPQADANGRIGFLLEKLYQ